MILIKLRKEFVSKKFWPSKAYRLSINHTDDGRTRLHFIHAGMLWNESSKQAIAFSRANLSLTYKPPLEFSIKPENIKLGQKEQIKIFVWSKVSDNSTILLEISNKTSRKLISLGKEIKKGVNEFSYSFKPKTIGLYKVRAVLRKQDPLVIGPRKAFFLVKKPRGKGKEEEKSEKKAPLALGLPIIKARASEHELYYEIPFINRNQTASYCGDGICQPDESPSFCPEDCSINTSIKKISKSKEKSKKQFQLVCHFSHLPIFF